MTINELKELHDEFLNRWTLDDVKKMNLQEYVDIGNRDTYCQWVETKTRLLGSIKGLSSIKFGIYRRKDRSRKPSNFQNDDSYTWRREYGDSRNEAFQTVKRHIIDTIDLSINGKFNEIDDIDLPDLFKWKVAFLYSNERLIPIYKREVLNRIAEHFGLKISRRTKISDIQNLMIISKPANINVYEYMRGLYSQFGNEDDTELLTTREGTRSIRRRAAESKNIKPQIRTISRSFIVEQKHNQIQENLKEILVKQYGKANVFLEENYVDIKVTQPEYISLYEVKASSYASECVKEALGQILLYSFNDKDKRKKKHYIVGQYPPTEKDTEYINFIKNNLKQEIDYINIDINP